MNFPRILRSIGNYGVKSTYKPWEIHLTRKLNLAAVLGAFNVIAGLIIFCSFGYYNSILECLVVLVLAPFTFLLNKRFGYTAALYLFTFIGCFLFFFLSVKMGPDSLSFLYYFPLIIGLIQMAGRREMYFHLVLLCLFCSVSIILVVMSYQFRLFEPEVSVKAAGVMRYINIFFSFFTCTGFIFIISREAVKQEKQLESALQQKEVLLAELFHRVKNNLNIVTSLLNLKKNSTNSAEVHDVLEECRNMVFSMAMVHTRIYNSNNIDHLNFTLYLKDLSTELINSIGGRDKVDLETEGPLIHLNLAQAIPCGLIINELITNSFKHAQLPGQKLKIKIVFTETNEFILMNVSDNGPGKKESGNASNTLGLELIKSLAEQLEAEYRFKSGIGFGFQLKFSKTKGTTTAQLH